MGVLHRIPAPDVDRALSMVSGSRDRVIDLLRAWSMTVVVAGHALMAVVLWRGGYPHLGNTLAATPWLHPITWLLQVLPIFFMVGATANGYSWQAARREQQRYSVWVWHRVQRLLRPVISYLGIMALIGFTVGGLGDPRTAAPLLTLSTQLLWFLGAYLWVMAATPMLLVLADRHATVTIAGLVTIVAAIDFERLHRGGSAAWGLLNFFAVWLLAGVLGVLLGRGIPGTRAWWMVLGSLAVNITLVTRAGYPVSLVGMPGARISNMDPPTLVLLVHCCTLFGLIVLLRSWLSALVERPRVWRATVTMNMLMMTVYLWHLPVLTALTLVEHMLGWERPVGWREPIGPMPLYGFWPWTILHLAVFFALLIAVLRVTWIFEYARIPWWDSTPRPATGRPDWWAAVGVALLGVGISVISATGLTGFPTRVTEYQGVPFNSGVAVLLMACGIVLARRSAAPAVEGQAQRP